ncbi:mycothiol transferase [Promicromonospora panici]|uniref:mycothiol transferase n=1 Tax=Promicromonospora panici TaxID=2219658 RepID=UPI00101C3C03|nr:DinB family protein [Promicromonospora panici]
MRSTDLLVDAFNRIQQTVRHAVKGLTAEELAFRVDEDANSVAWLIWHLSRVQDDHIADAAGTSQVWSDDAWDRRFGLPFPAEDTGYGHDADEVSAVRVPSGELLTAYHDAVHDRTIRYLGTLSDADLDQVIDESWNPPVTLGVRLVSVVNDDIQHAGQAAFVRGVALRRRSH